MTTFSALSVVNVHVNLPAEGFGNRLNSAALTVPASLQLIETLSDLVFAFPQAFVAVTRTFPETLPQFTEIVPEP